MGFFNTVFYQPIFNGLIVLHRFLPGHDLGVAIVIITIAIRFILIWPSLSQIRSSRALQELQPKLKALQQKYANDRQELAKQTMAIYREHKVNPLSSCLPLLIQLPFLFALYQVFISGIQTDPGTHLLQETQLAKLYGPLQDIYATTPIDSISFGFINLAGKNNIILAAIVALTQFWQTKMLAPKATPPNTPGAKDERMATSMTRQMNVVMPIVTGWISYILPAGLGLYFLVSNFFSIIQQWLLLRNEKNKKTQAA